MSGAVILAKVQNYLTQLNKGNGTKVEFQTINGLAGRVSSVFRRTLNPDNPKREFRLRMSNLGRPGCILQAERFGFNREPAAYSDRMRNAFGDLIEATAIAIMRQAGVDVRGEQTQVSLEVAGKMIDGTLDVTIAEPDERVYDVKSSSSYNFKHKYKDATLETLWKEGDDFGYVTQIYCYSQASGIPVGGLIIVNKEDGQWAIVEPPPDDKGLRQEALKKAAENVVRLISDKPFSKDFSLIEETFRKRKTGKKILCTNCSFCSYKETCWPTAEYKPQEASSGANPRSYYYVDD